jgi:hypothetical protein
VLPLLGLGCILALVHPRLATFGALLAALGFWLGLHFLGTLITSIAARPAMANWVGLPGPIACVAVGLALAASGWLRYWLVPPAAMVIGAMLAIGIELADPDTDDPHFLLGASAASLWLIVAIAIIGRLCDRRWFRIATRILGSWLIAIGLMLGAAILLPRSKIGDAAPLPPTRLEGPVAPDGDPGSPQIERSRSPFAPPGLDPLRQP